MCMKYSMLPGLVDLWKHMLNLFHTINIQGRELYLGEFIKNTFNTGFCLNACELISYTFVMLIGMTLLFTVAPL